MLRRINGVGATAIIVLLLGVMADDAQASAPRAARTVSCQVGDGAGFGYQYLLSLKVTGTSCRTGDKLVRAKGKLAGWRCTGKVLQKDKVQLVARDTCKRTPGSASAVYEYSQLR
jgi:hypothetical protein